MDEPKPEYPPSWLEKPPETHRFVEAGDGFVYVDKSSLINNATIGRFTYIGPACMFDGLFPIVIGSFCMISGEVYCHTRDGHQLGHVTAYPLRSVLGLDIGYNELDERPQGVTVGNDVWLGHEVRLMPGVSIGNGAVVGARAVVTGNLEPYGIYGGVPARLIRYRYAKPIIDALQDIQWWKWPLQKIMRNVDFFNTDLTQTTDPDELYRKIVP